MRLFATLRCVSVPGMDHDDLGRPMAKSVMAVAYEVACEHRPFGYVIISCIVWVAGVPLAVFAVLYHNRRHLYNKESAKHGTVVGEYGTLYLRKCFFLI